MQRVWIPIHRSALTIRYLIDIFVKGYTPQGFKGQVFHVHVNYSSDWDELYFRDYLLKHPEIAARYGNLKLEYKKKYEHDRDGYTNAKLILLNGLPGWPG